VRIGPLAGLPAILRELGHDPEPIFGRVGFKLAQFADPDTVISFVGASRLLALSVAATGCQQLGLLLGERSGPSSLGIAGFLLRTAPDVRTALTDVVRHLDLHDQGGVPMLLVKGDVTFLGYAIHQPAAQATDQIYDLAITIACNIMRHLCGARWNPAEVLLSRAPPEDPAPYKRFFRAHLLFDASQSAVVFP
jgi:hypothetical protein